MNPSVARILDANSNRAREALWVLEDYVRFAVNDQKLAGEIKTLRHTLAGALRLLEVDAAILSRDTQGDVGTTNKTAAEFERATLADVLIANAKRLSEALRVLEEVGKTIDPEAAAAIEKLRYRGYVLEQTLTRMALQTGRFSATGVYVLLTEALCRRSWEETLEAVLRGGASVVQLREKSLPDGTLLRRAERIVAACRAAGAVSIINDRVDIALLAGADGVHVGQGDLPCAAIRKIAGHAFIVGVSTGVIEEAHQAVRDDASYVGVGPMFPTTTKEKPRLAGPVYAEEAIEKLAIPSVAIGGITRDNIGALKAVGVKTVAVCSAVIGDADPEARTRELIAALA